MAVTQQVIVEFVIDDSQLRPAIDLLEKTGQVDAKLANGFKQTTAEINKQAAAIKESTNSTTPLKRNLEDVSKVVKNTTSVFVQGFQEGVTETLKEAGVSIIQLKKSLGTFNQASPFDKLNKSLSDTTKRVLDISARIEQLRRTGGEGTEAFKNMEKQLKADQHELKRLADEIAVVKQATDVFGESEKNTSNATESLRQRLRILTQQITELKLSGKDNTEQFREMVIEAGRVRKAMNDAGKEVNNLASATPVLDGMLSAAQGVAGGFAAAQGSIALFGGESEEIQKTLLRVNAYMAILQGLQQVENVLGKESAAIKLFENRQRIIANAQIAVENGLNSTSIIVRLGAAAAQRVLNAVMAANPILLFVSALILVVSALAAYVVSSRKAEVQTGELNAAVEAATEGFENYASQIKRQSELATSELEKNGALQSKILETQLQSEQDINKKRSEEIARLRKFLTSSRDADEEAIKAANDRLKQLAQDRNAADAEEVKKTNEIKKQLRDEDIKSQIATAETALLATSEGSEKQLQLQQRLVSLQAQAALNAAGLTEAEKTAIAAKAAQERHELQNAFDKRRIDLELKAIEVSLVNVREGSQQEFNLRIQQLRLQTQAETTSTKLSEAEKKAIREKGLQDQIKLQREFNAHIRQETIQGQIDLNSAELVNVRINSEDKLLLTISNIELVAALEIDAAKENADKIKAINAKRDADIAAANKSFIEQQATEAIELINARAGAENRALQRLANDEQQSVRTRIASLQQLAEFDLNNIQTREDALEEERKKRLIGEEEYNSRYAQLQDDKAKTSEDAEKKITDIHLAENEKRRKKEQETIELVIQTVGQVIDIIQQLNDIRTKKDEERIAGERARVQELREAGAITEKEAILSNKRIDNEERKLKQQAAIRDKQIAIFNAVVNTAQAVTRALATGGPILAAIAGAIGAAQIAIIASRPIPKFGTGKKNQYEGPGKIGEAGAELFEHDGRMFLAKKETIVWLGKDDKVYTPSETKRMLPEVDKKVMISKPTENRAEAIDYDLLGKAVGKNINIPGMSFDENGFKAWTQEGMSIKNYMDKRYSSQ